MAILLENMTIQLLLASLSLFFQVGGSSTIYSNVIKESRRISEHTWSHFSPMHFSMRTTAASTNVQIKSISFSETILVLSGHDWHLFQVPNDKEASEDRLHSSGPQQDLTWALGIFRDIFFTSLTDDYL